MTRYFNQVSKFTLKICNKKDGNRPSIVNGIRIIQLKQGTIKPPLFHLTIQSWLLEIDSFLFHFVIYIYILLAPLNAYDIKLCKICVKIWHFCIIHVPVLVHITILKKMFFVQIWMVNICFINGTRLFKQSMTLQ
jgi:hypothetical protein